MGLCLIRLDFPDNIVKAVAVLAQLLQLFGQERHFRPRGQAVDDQHPAVGVLLLILPGSQAGGVVAARQRAGDGDTEDVLRVAKGKAPVLRGGAGGRGGPLVIAQGLQHVVYVHVLVVHPGVVGGGYLQRHRGKIHPGQREQIRRGVSHNSAIQHWLFPHNSSVTVRVPDNRYHYNSFRKTCQEIY